MCVDIYNKNMELNLQNPEHAYIIGLLQTDGSHYETTRNRGRISLELQASDIDILHKLKNIFTCESYITTRKRDTNFKSDYESCSLSIYDLDTRNSLKEYIPVGKKSNIILMPENIIEIDYWRGVFDGDGSLGLTKDKIPFVSLVTKSECLANNFKTFVHKILNIEMCTSRNSRDGVYNLMLTKENAQLLCSILYYEDCLCLKRKKDKSVEVMGWIRPENMKRKTWSVKKWSIEEDEFILSHDIYESMEVLKRTKKSIETRLYRLKTK